MFRFIIIHISVWLLTAALLGQTPIPADGEIFSPVRPDQKQSDPDPSAIVIARLHYGGGGDWYLGNSAVPNLLEFIRDETGGPVEMEEKQVKIEDEDLFSYPFLFATGHGVIRFNEPEQERLRKYLLAGGFLFINDSYGMDKSVRQSVAELFPEYQFQEIPFDHPIYHCFYDFPNGPPKIHEHDKKPASGWGIIIDGRLVLFYLHESDIGDGWEDPHVYNDPPEKRTEALRMGLNIVTYATAF